VKKVLKNGDKENNYYIVKLDILPEAIKKTIIVKEMLKRGEETTVNSAVEKVGLSRSAYYKYKDAVFPFFEASKQKIITLSLVLSNQPGVLSMVLNTIAEVDGNVLTINQGIPLQGVAYVTISFETLQLKVELEDLINRIGEIKGVIKTEIIAQS
jgi:chorismate mutase